MITYVIRIFEYIVYCLPYSNSIFGAMLNQHIGQNLYFLSILNLLLQFLTITIIRIQYKQCFFYPLQISANRIVLLVNFDHDRQHFVPLVSQKLCVTIIIRYTIMCIHVQSTTESSSVIFQLNQGCRSF